MTMPHPDCRYLLDDLSEYVDGAASAALCAEMERHMAGCIDCRAVVDTLRKTVALYRGLPKPALDAEMRARLYRSLGLPNFTPKTVVK